MLIKKLSIILALIAGLLAGSVVAQDETLPGDPLSQEEVIALLESSGVTIYPFEAIEATAPVLVGLTSTSTRLEVSTTLPVSCLIVFGETLDFGRVAQDADMGESGAHEDHSPILSDLEPETSYYYRLQGSDTHGNFYVSEVFTFTTPPESDEVSDNLLSPARGAEVLEVSSNFGDGTNDSRWGILNALDDDPNTQWSSNGDGNEAYFTVALGERSYIHTINFWTRTMSNDTAQIFSFTITTETGEVFGPFDLPDPQQAYEFEVDIVAETLRFDVIDSNGGNTGVVDVAVYGEPAE